MPPKFIIVNTNTSGKFETLAINNRPHLKTTMKSIELDSVMNGRLYTKAFVTNRMDQLNGLMVPSSHPKVNGQLIPAEHPLAVNANGIGAFLGSPRIEGDFVVNDLFIDIEAAEKVDDGKEAMKRIRNGEAIGVSTGITEPKFIANTGEVKGRKHTEEITEGRFNHVAALLNETPAGESTFTVNSEGGDTEVMVCNVATSANDLRSLARGVLEDKFSSDTQNAWLRDVIFSPQQILFELNIQGQREKLMVVPFGYDESGAMVLTGEALEAHEKRVIEIINTPAGTPITTNADGGAMKDFNKTAFVLALIGNAANMLVVNDKDRLEELTEKELALAVNDSLTPPTVPQAQAVIEGAGMAVNSMDDAEAYGVYQKRKASFDAFLDGENKARDEKVKTIVGNSEMSEDEVRKMGDAGIDSLVKVFSKPAQDFSARGQSITANSRAPGGDNAADAVDYS